MKLIDTTEKLFQPARAEEIAAELTTHDLDGWRYEAVHCPNGTGYSYIDVFDEAGDFVGHWM